MLRLACICLIVSSLSLPTRSGAADLVTLGDSYMTAVTDVLDRLQIAHEAAAIGPLLHRDPASVKVLFIAHDVASVAGFADWLRRFRATGGVLFTFYTPAPAVAQILGIELGEYVANNTGRYAAMGTAGAVAEAPDVMRQRSNNIHQARALADSVRVVANWLDAAGRDTGEAALLLSPAGVHMTHVLLGQDPAAATRLYAALLGHFLPDMWAPMVEGALLQARTVGGGEAALVAGAGTDKKTHTALADFRAALADAGVAAAAGHPGAALDFAAVARNAATVAYARSQKGREGELRAVWIHDSFGVADWGWDRSMKVLAEAGLNAIIPNMLDAGQASYPSAWLPPHPRVAAEGDQMAQLLAAAHRHGIEVHAWKVNYNLNTAPPEFVERMRREGRLQADADGHEMPWLCPSHPENRRLEAETMLEVVRNYDVDGIHFDYIRYPGSEGCYDDGCRIRFQAQTGHIVTDWPRDVLTGPLTEPFQKWRQEQITALVRDVAVRSRDIRAEVQISAAVFSQWDQSRYTVGQDWVLWAQEGYLDFVCPMNYIPNVQQFEATVRRQVDWIDGRIPLYSGIGAWQMSSVEEILAEVEATRRLGADGFVLFEYSADLATRVLPMLRAGLTKVPTHEAHSGPSVRLVVAGHATRDAGTGTPIYAVGQAVQVEAQLVSRAAVPQAGAMLSMEPVDGRGTVAELQDLRTGEAARQLDFAAGEPGDYRPVVHGRFSDEKGRKHDFTRRGPLVRVRSATQIDSLMNRFAPPPRMAEGAAVAVFAEAHGAGSIRLALSAHNRVSAFLVSRLTEQVLAQTDVLVIPQPLNRWVFDAQDRQRLRQWVADGGGLLVTHDMAGLRGALPIVPEVCARGTGFPQGAQWQVVPGHPAVAGIAAGLHPHSYYDHVTLEPGPQGHVLATGDEGEPVLVVGDFGAGRYAALGLIPGLGADDGEVPLVGAEGQLVTSLIDWLRHGD